MGNDADTGLSAAELGALRAIAGAMIPADGGLGMPGADDPGIQADIVRSLGRDLVPVRAALAAIMTTAAGGFAAMDPDGREALIERWFAGGGEPAATFARVILGAYYRDDRVLLAVGMEPRAPFPKGYALDQGDWSLLDAVRGRQAFWRDDRIGAAGTATGTGGER